MTPTASPAAPDAGAQAPDLLRNRRSIRKLAAGEVSPEALAAITGAIETAPASMGTTPWKIVLLRERREAFWALVEQAFRDQLSGEQLDRYLARLEGFRPAGLVALVYEDMAVREALEAKGVPAGMALDFNWQGLGIVQLAIWLAAAEHGLGASLQHWNSQLEEPLAAFLGLDPAVYRLVAQIPIGIPAEVPGPRNPERARGWVLDPAPAEA